MENPIIWICMMTPGFAGLAVLKLLNGDTTDGAVQQNVLKYFLFGSLSLLIAEAARLFHGPLSKILEHSPITLWDCVIPMVAAVILAVFWYVAGLRIAVKIANRINTAAGKNPIFLQHDLLERILNDGQSHFLEIRFPDGTKQKGYVSDVITSRRSLILRPEPAWTADYVRQDIQTLVELSTGIIVTEYRFK